MKHKGMTSRFFLSRGFVIIGAMFFSGLMLSACGSGDSSSDPMQGAGGAMEAMHGEATISQELEGIHIEDPWARPGVEGRMSAAYFLLTNYGDEDDRLLSAASDVAIRVEVHESYEAEEGMMGMREMEALPVPAGETVQFRQGGLHIMFIQLTRPLSDGDEIALTLTFEKAGDMTIDVPVRL